MLSEPGFQGRIGRTYQESEPWWPTLPGGLGGPNVVMIVLDDTGFAHFNCYGSTLQTPNIDQLAAGGLRYTGFHTTALCSPTRACLLSGRNHHAVGMRGVSNWNTGFPHMRGGITPRAATIAELLRNHGYATYAAGKWHLAPMEETSAAGPHHNWPLQKGFDKFYGFLQGESDQFSPELTRDNHHLEPPATLPDGRPYHFSEDIVDQSMGWVRDLVSVRPDRPFFLYLAFGAMHAPHQAPADYLARWKGRFDEGYDVLRDRWYQRQVELGVVPAGTTQAPRNPGVPPWNDLTPNQQAFSCRLQEAFAAMLEHTDDQIGRLTTFLQQHDLLDDTVIMVLSDNGASREGGPFGVMNEFSFFNGNFEDIDRIVEHRLDDIGTAHSHSNYPWGWAQAGNSPLRWYKQNTYGGGVRDPLVVHWPAGISARGEVRHQFCHAVDIAATVLDITGAPAPQHVAGHEQIPMHGRSITSTFDDAAAPPPRRVQYFEQMGHRGIWALDADGAAWKATTYHVPGHAYDDDEWELFRLDDDFSECHDLAAAQPEKLREMIDLWWSQAGEMGVLPLDDRTIELFGGTPRPGTPHARTSYDYLAPISHIPSDVCPPLGGRNWTLTLETTVGAQPAQGVLYARGNHSVGHSFFLKDGLLHFDYNALGERYRATAPLTLVAGEHTLTARFERSGKGGVLHIGADGTDLASAEVPRIVRMLGSTGLDIGRDGVAPSVDDYAAPFAFTGTIHRARFDIHTRRDAADIAATAAAELARE
ncbi:MAG: arylsulfatase [Actinomycetota bacterium]|nr:arylsulfatase [Actinomycetota bacterium]